MKAQLLAEQIRVNKIRKSQQLKTSKQTAVWLDKERSLFKASNQRRKRFFEQREAELQAAEQSLRAASEQFGSIGQMLRASAYNAALSRKKLFEENLKLEQEKYELQKQSQDEQLQQITGDDSSGKSEIKNNLQEAARKQSETYLEKVQMLTRDFQEAVKNAATAISLQLADAKLSFTEDQLKLQRNSEELLEKWSARLAQFQQREIQETQAARQKRLRWWRRGAAQKKKRRNARKMARLRLAIQWWQQLVKLDGSRLRLVDRDMQQMQLWSTNFEQFRQKRLHRYIRWVQDFQNQQQENYKAIESTHKPEDVQQVQNVMNRESKSKDAARLRMKTHLKVAIKTMRTALKRRLSKHHIKREKLAQMLEFDTAQLAQLQTMFKLPTVGSAVSSTFKTSLPTQAQQHWWNTGFKLDTEFDTGSHAWLDSMHAKRLKQEKQQTLAAHIEQSKLESNWRELSSVQIPAGFPSIPTDIKDAKSVLSNVGDAFIDNRPVPQSPVTTHQAALVPTDSEDGEPVRTRKLIDFVSTPYGYSVKFSIRPRETSKAQTAVLYHGSAFDNPGVYFKEGTTQLVIQSANVASSSSTLTLAQSLPLKQWSSVTITHGSTGKITVDINGTLAQSMNSWFPLSQDGPVYLGNPQFGYPVAPADFKDFEFKALENVGRHVTAGQVVVQPIATPNGYELSFSLFPNDVVAAPANIIHRGTQSRFDLSISFANNTSTLLIGVKKVVLGNVDLPLHQWSKVYISHNAQGIFKVKLNGNEVLSSRTKKPFPDGTLYASNSWAVPADANIKDILLNALLDPQTNR